MVEAFQKHRCEKLCLGTQSADLMPDNHRLSTSKKLLSSAPESPDELFNWENTFDMLQISSMHINI